MLRKQGIELVTVVTIVFGIVLFVHYGSPRFWGEFTGMTEAEVREQLGEPFRDSRDNKDKGADEYTLGWYQGFDVALFLDFKEGVVVSEERISR